MPIDGLHLSESKRKAIKLSMDENDTKVKGNSVNALVWSQWKDKALGTSASLGTWFDTPEAAGWSISNGLIRGQRYVGSAEAYQIKKKRCHRCLGYGHLAWPCREKTRCRHCSGEHGRRDCALGSVARCADCQGLHPTGEQACKGSTVPASSQR